MMKEEGTRSRAAISNLFLHIVGVEHQMGQPTNSDSGKSPVSRQCSRSTKISQVHKLLQKLLLLDF